MSLLSLALGIVEPWPLKILGGIKGGLSWVVSSSTHILIVACVCLSLYGWHEHSAAKGWEIKADQCQATYKKAVSDAKQATVAYEAKSKEKADAGQSNYNALVVAGHGRVSDYISTHAVGVQPTGPENQSSSAKDQSARLSEISSSNTSLAVTIPSAVLTIADADYSYAQACYIWAQDLNK